MASRVDKERVKILLEKSGLNDREIGERIGVHQTTIWRLRSGAISKVSKYLDRLEALSQLERKEGDLAELSELAKKSPALKAVLESLLHFMREAPGDWRPG
jgi:transcriptional regulator with XRE-family HTH domain